MGASCILFFSSFLLFSVVARFSEGHEINSLGAFGKFLFSCFHSFFLSFTVPK